MISTTNGDDTMRTRTTLAAAALLAIGILLGWLAASGRLAPDVQAQDKVPAQPKTADPHGWIGTETVKTRFGDFEFKNGYPTADATDKLYEVRTFNRAVEVYLTHIPAISMFHIRKGLKDFGIDAANKLLIFETLMDAQSLFLTGNTETVYGMGFLDLKRDGPTVVEVPPMMLGGAMDMWMRGIVDIGPPGADKGKGGKFLFLPPDHKGEAPEGYFVVKSPTYGIWLGVRGFLVDGK